MFGISWKEHLTNISILEVEEIGLERELMGKVARMKLQFLSFYSTNVKTPKPSMIVKLLLSVLIYLIC